VNSEEWEKYCFIKKTWVVHYVFFLCKYTLFADSSPLFTEKRFLLG